MDHLAVPIAHRPARTLTTGAQQQTQSSNPNGSPMPVVPKLTDDDIERQFRAISRPSVPCTDSWNFREIFASGSVMPNCILTADVDEDGVDEIIIGSTDGLIAILKTTQRTPMAKMSVQGTIAALSYECPPRTSPGAPNSTSIVIGGGGATGQHHAPADRTATDEKQQQPGSSGGGQTSLVRGVSSGALVNMGSSTTSSTSTTHQQSQSNVAGGSQEGTSCGGVLYVMSLEGLLTEINVGALLSNSVATSLVQPTSNLLAPPSSSSAINKAQLNLSSPSLGDSSSASGAAIHRVDPMTVGGSPGSQGSTPHHTKDDAPISKGSSPLLLPTAAGGGGHLLEVLPPSIHQQRQGPIPTRGTQQPTTAPPLRVTTRVQVIPANVTCSAVVGEFLVLGSLDRRVYVFYRHNLELATSYFLASQVCSIQPIPLPLFPRQQQHSLPPFVAAGSASTMPSRTASTSPFSPHGNHPHHHAPHRNSNAHYNGSSGFLQPSADIQPMSPALSQCVVVASTMHVLIIDLASPRLSRSLATSTGSSLFPQGRGDPAAPGGSKQQASSGSVSPTVQSTNRLKFPPPPASSHGPSAVRRLDTSTSQTSLTSLGNSTPKAKGSGGTAGGSRASSPHAAPSGGVGLEEEFGFAHWVHAIDRNTFSIHGGVPAAGSAGSTFQESPPVAQTQAKQQVAGPVSNPRLVASCHVTTFEQSTYIAVSTEDGYCSLFEMQWGSITGEMRDSGISHDALAHHHRHLGVGAGYVQGSGHFPTPWQPIASHFETVSALASLPPERPVQTTPPPPPLNISSNSLSSMGTAAYSQSSGATSTTPSTQKQQQHLQQGDSAQCLLSQYPWQPFLCVRQLWGIKTHGGAQRVTVTPTTRSVMIPSTTTATGWPFGGYISGSFSQSQFNPNGSNQLLQGRDQSERVTASLSTPKAAAVKELARANQEKHPGHLGSLFPGFHHKPLPSQSSNTPLRHNSVATAGRDSYGDPHSQMHFPEIMPDSDSRCNSVNIQASTTPINNNNVALRSIPKKRCTYVDVVVVIGTSTGHLYVIDRYANTLLSRVPDRAMAFLPLTSTSPAATFTSFGASPSHPLRHHQPIHNPPPYPKQPHQQQPSPSNPALQIQPNILNFVSVSVKEMVLLTVSVASLGTEGIGRSVSAEGLAATNSTVRLLNMVRDKGTDTPSHTLHQHHHHHHNTLSGLDVEWLSSLLCNVVSVETSMESSDGSGRSRFLPVSFSVPISTTQLPRTNSIDMFTSKVDVAQRQRELSDDDDSGTSPLPVASTAPASVATVGGYLTHIPTGSYNSNAVTNAPQAEKVVSDECVISNAVITSLAEVASVFRDRLLQTRGQSGGERAANDSLSSIRGRTGGVSPHFGGSVPQGTTTIAAPLSATTALGASAKTAVAALGDTMLAGSVKSINVLQEDEAFSGAMSAIAVLLNGYTDRQWEVLGEVALEASPSL